jgi:hypothetical protein
MNPTNEKPLISQSTTEDQPVYKKRSRDARKNPSRMGRWTKHDTKQENTKFPRRNKPVNGLINYVISAGMTLKRTGRAIIPILTITRD